MTIDRILLDGFDAVAFADRCDAARVAEACRAGYERLYAHRLRV